MKITIVGSHSDVYFRHVDEAIRASGWEDQISEIVSGSAIGTERNSEIWAIRHRIPYTVRKPDFDQYGKLARREWIAEMVEQVDAVIAVWDGLNRGTKSMIDAARRKDLPLFIYRVEPPPIEELDVAERFGIG